MDQAVSETFKNRFKLSRAMSRMTTILHRIGIKSANSSFLDHEVRFLNKFAPWSP